MYKTQNLNTLKKLKEIVYEKLLSEEPSPFFLKEMYSYSSQVILIPAIK